jgi:hypothetical protein
MLYAPAARGPANAPTVAGIALGSRDGTKATLLTLEHALERATAIMMCSAARASTVNMVPLVFSADLYRLSVPQNVPLTPQIGTTEMYQYTLVSRLKARALRSSARLEGTPR